MSLAVASRIARRELRGGLRGFAVFLTCLALGVAAIAGVGTVRASIDAGLAREGKRLLGGAAELSLTYRFATPEERRWMAAEASHVSEIVDFRSMVVVGAGAEAERALTQVKAVDGLYPLVGDTQLEPEQPLEAALGLQGGLPGAVMAPLLANRLGLAPGDDFALGETRFRLSALLTHEPDNAGTGFSLGPRTLVLRRALDGSGLLQPGTLFETRYRLELPEGADLDRVEEEARAAFAAAGMRWRDARNGAPGLSEFVDRLSAFLVLVGLAGLAVGGIGVSTAVRAYLAGKTATIATLRTLGASGRVIFRAYLLQIGALAALGIAIGLALGAGIPLLIAPALERLLPVPAVFALHPAPLLEAALYGGLTALVFTLWPLARTEEIRAAALYRDGGPSGVTLPRARHLLVILGAAAALVGAAAVFTGAPELTGWTALGILGALVLLWLIAAGLRRLARRAKTLARGRPALRAGLAAIGGPVDETTPVVLALGLGLTVLAAIGQIDGNMQRAIAQELPDEAPSFFFVDIQRDQMPGIERRIAQDPAVRKMEAAPMLRGVITRINGQPAKEVAGDHWVLEGDRGVTYADAQPERTRLVAGEWWPEGYTGPPQISFAATEAEEMGLALGDEITVNVLGRDITGTLTSLRAVDFSTAGMGFVLAMNEAALAGAPHSFIATVYAEEAAEALLLRDLASAYPNITAISVREAIERVAGLLAGIASATRYGAAATLLTGIVVLIGTAAAGQGARLQEAALLRTLGATRRTILSSFALRAGLMGAGAGLVALLSGILGAWAILHFVMETRFAVVWSNAASVILGGAAASLLAGLAFAWRPLQARPAHVLRTRE